jgi:hypothetical protein
VPNGTVLLVCALEQTDEPDLSKLISLTAILFLSEQSPAARVQAIAKSGAPESVPLLRCGEQELDEREIL